MPKPSMEEQIRESLRQVQARLTYNEEEHDVLKNLERGMMGWREIQEKEPVIDGHTLSAALGAEGAGE